MTRARDVASALSGALSASDTVSQTLSNKTIDGNNNTITTKRGGTSSRPSTPTTGTLYYNTDDDKLQIYDAGWEDVSQEPAPILTEIDPVTAATTGTSITITGSYIQTGATVKFIGTDATERTAASVSVVSSGEITATTPSLPVAYEPYDVKVINPDNQFATLDDALDAGGTPTWSTASGTLATINENTSLSTSVSASDPDGTSIVYSSSNLPAWISLNSSTGALTGTAPDIESNTTYNFNITASDGVNTSSRAFAVVSNYVPPFTTSIGFGSNSQASSFSTYTGGDGISRANGKCGPGTTGYHGVCLNKYFPADKDFELIIKVSQNSDGTSTGENNHYMGLGWVYGNGYSDSAANISFNPSLGWYGGDTSVFDGITGTKYANYYNTDNGSDVPATGYGFPLFFKFTRVGNTFNAFYGRSYTTATNQVGQISVPANVAGKDIILAFGEASGTEYFFIEKFTMII